MTQFTLKKAKDMPVGSARLSLANAVRNLEPTQAIFIAASEGPDLETVRSRAASTAYPLGAKVRTDREADGVWIYRQG